MRRSRNPESQLLIESGERLCAHADGVGATDGGRDKCGDIIMRGLGGGREAAIGFADKADIYFVADGD